MQELLETFDNPVNLSEWFSTEPKFHRVGGQRLGLTIQNERRSKCIVSHRSKRKKQHLQDTLCAMRHALCDSDPNRGLPSVVCETDASGTITAYKAGT